MNPGVSERSLAAAAAAIVEIDRGRITLDDFLDRSCDADIRRITGHLLFCCFRRRRFIDSIIAALVSRPPKPEVQALLETSLARLFFQSGSSRGSAVNVAVECAKKFRAEKFVNGVLRNALRRDFPVDDAPQAVLPENILRQWSRRFDAETLAEMTGLFLTPAPVTFRLLDGFELPENFPAEAVPGFGDFRFFVTSDPEKVLASELFAAGGIYFQDPSTSFAVSLADYRSCRNAVDICAAPGGKALMLSEMMPDVPLTLLDRSAARQKLTAENFARRNRKCDIRTGDARNFSGSYDLVLADVPCSNTGVFRRRPDALWRYSEKSAAEIISLQQQILHHAATLVSPGGQLIYSTCSIEPEENTIAAGKFIAGNPDFEIVRAGIILPDETRDGAGAVLLRKKE